MPTNNDSSHSGASVNQVYLRNMAGVWRHDRELARRIDAIPDEARYEPEPTRSGELTLAVPNAQGQNIYLHSRYNPVDEAKKLTANLDENSTYCFVVGGLGLGYHIRELASLVSEETIIVVSEPDLRLVATALAHVDLSELLDDDRLVIFPELDKKALHERLEKKSDLMMLGTKFVSHPPSQRIAGEFHAQLRALMTDFVAYCRMTLTTLLANSQITCQNVAYNLPSYVTTPPIDMLRRRFSGIPAVIVSAGPSLRKNIDLLSEVKDRAIICAVQTTLKPLLDRGIEPDFVTSLDFHEVSKQYFEGLEELKNVHLIAEPKATWHVVETFPGKASLLDNRFARLLIGDDIAPRDALQAGATVAHLSFYLAHYMGCDPIIFVGQDLAFTGHVFYVPGVETHRTWRSEINRFNTMETKEWERIVRNRPVLRKTIGNDDKEIYSDELLFTYLEQFEKDIAGTGARVINATEGGARIRGTEVMTLREAIDRWCTREIPKSLFSYRETTNWHDTSKLEATHAEIAARIADTESMENICKEMVELLTKLEGLTHNPAIFNRTLVRVDELRAQVNQSQRIYRIISAASQLAELRRFRADRQLVAAKDTGVKRALNQLKRDKEFVNSIMEASRKMHEILNGALMRLEAAISESKCS